MLLKDSTIAWFRLKDGYKQAIATIKLKIAPGIFAVLFLYGGVALASHYIFNIRDSFGDFCKPDPKASKLDLCTPAEVGLCTQAADGTLPDTCTKLCAVKTEFDTRNVCTSTKVKVFAAQTYAFEISKKDEWSFLGAPSGPGGMPLSEFWHHKDPAGGVQPSLWRRWRPWVRHIRSNALSIVRLDGSLPATETPAIRKISSTRATIPERSNI